MTKINPDGLRAVLDDAGLLWDEWDTPDVREWLVYGLRFVSFELVVDAYGLDPGSAPFTDAQLMEKYGDYAVAATLPPAELAKVVVGALVVLLDAFKVLEKLIDPPNSHLAKRVEPRETRDPDEPAETSGLPAAVLMAACDYKRHRWTTTIRILTQQGFVECDDETPDGFTIYRFTEAGRDFTEKCGIGRLPLSCTTIGRVDHHLFYRPAAPA